MSGMTLRGAGFRATDSVLDVAHRTGQSVDEVLRQTGLTSATDVVSRALDAPFSFPDAFARSQETAQRPAPGAAATTSNTGGAALLRLKVEAGFQKKAAAAASWGLPTDPKAYPHGGAFMGAFLGQLSGPGRVDSMERAQQLVDRLGITPYVYGGSVDELLFSAYSHLESRFGEHAAVAKQIIGALAEPLAEVAPKAGEPLPARLDTSSVPTDPSRYPHEGAFMGAFIGALSKPGLVDSPRRADELARRLGIGSTVTPDDDVQTYLFSVFEQMRSRSSAKGAAAAILAKLSAPS